MNPQRQRLLLEFFMSEPGPRFDAPGPPRPQELNRTGANASRVRKNATMSRHQHTKRHTPLTHTNTTPLSTAGDISPNKEEMEEAQLEALFQLADQLERGSQRIKQDAANSTLFPGRAVTLNQETDPFRAFILGWACHGPSGRDIPGHLPLNRSQVRVLNERVRRVMANRGLQMITPVPLPPLPTTNVPPLS